MLSHLGHRKLLGHCIVFLMSGWLSRKVTPRLAPRVIEIMASVWSWSWSVLWKSIRFPILRSRLRVAVEKITSATFRSKRRVVETTPTNDQRRFKFVESCRKVCGVGMNRRPTFESLTRRNFQRKKYDFIHRVKKIRGWNRTQQFIAWLVLLASLCLGIPKVSGSNSVSVFLPWWVNSNTAAIEGHRPLSLKILYVEFFSTLDFRH